MNRVEKEKLKEIVTYIKNSLKLTNSLKQKRGLQKNQYENVAQMHLQISMKAILDDVKKLIRKVRNVK